MPMDDVTKTPPTENPYTFERDEALETFARAVIGEAIAKSATSPRSFGHLSMMGAKQIVAYVLANFDRKRL